MPQLEQLILPLLLFSIVRCGKLRNKTKNLTLIFTYTADKEAYSDFYFRFNPEIEFLFITLRLILFCYLYS